MDELIRLKTAAREEGCDNLTWNDIQACIDQVNLSVQEEHERKSHTQIGTNAYDQLKPRDNLEIVTKKKEQKKDIFLSIHSPAVFTQNIQMCLFLTYTILTRKIKNNLVLQELQLLD